MGTIAVFLGSPRRSGNSERLACAAADIFAQEGHEVRTLVLNELYIRPCQACDACADGVACPELDDFKGLPDVMDRSSIWIIASPVYWWSVSAQMKLFVDRWYSVPKAVFSGKRVLALLTQGDTDPETGKHAVGMLGEALSYRGVERAEIELFTNLPDIASLDANPSYFERVRAIASGMLKS